MEGRRKPPILAIPAVRSGGRIVFERLNVDLKLPAGPLPAMFIPRAEAPPEPLTLAWPGLAPGLYDANHLNIWSDDAAETAQH